jgi:hypothetical protein
MQGAVQSIAPTCTFSRSVAHALRIGWGIVVVLCVGLSAALCTSSSAHAQAVSTPSADLSVRIEYDAPPTCPDRRSFETRLGARMKTPLAPAEPAPQLHVRIRVHDGEVRGSIVLATNDSRFTRQISARTCSEALDALALIAALMLDPRAAREPEPSVASDDAPTTALDAQVRAEAALTPRAASTVVERPARSGSAALPRDSRATVRVEALGAALMLSGIAPALRPGLGLGTRVRVRLRGPTELAASLGGRMALPHREQRATGAVDFQWWAAAAALCAGGRLLDDTFSLAACAASEWGRLGARGRRTLNARAGAVLWAAAGPSVLLSFQLRRRFSLHAHVEALLPLVRDSFLLADQTVHQVPWLTLRAGLGVACRIW